MFWRLSLFFVLQVTLSGWVLGAEKLDEFVFDIPKQRADLSLIEFAEQANMTLLFPLEQVEGKQTNQLSGQYSIKTGLSILLKNTGLMTEIRENGQISISVDPNTDGENNMNNKPKL